jgi:hypothetical protein
MFWKNYIDEIGSSDPDARASVASIASPAAIAAAAAAAASVHEGGEEETILFDHHSNEGSESTKAFSLAPESETSTPAAKADNTDDSSGGNRSENASYEMVEERNAEPEEEVSVDYELDELEAEIARELED